MRVKKKTVPKSKILANPRIGDAYVFETVTRYFTGRLIAVSKEYYVINDAAWIAHTGDYAAFLKTGTARSIEPVQDGVVSFIARAGLVSVQEWKHPLPRARV